MAAARRPASAAVRPLQLSDLPAAVSWVQGHLVHIVQAVGINAEGAAAALALYIAHPCHLMRPCPDARRADRQLHAQLAADKGCMP